MQRILNIHPYGLAASWFWNRYRNSQGVVFNAPSSASISSDAVSNTPQTQGLVESTTRSVINPIGTGIQAINFEPTGEPFINLHQNIYYSPSQTSLGSLNFCGKDRIGVSIRAFMDGDWTPANRPSGFSIYVTPRGFDTPHYQAFTVNSSGTVVVGNPKNVSSDLVSFGVYRNGVMQLPKVPTIQDLDRVPPSNGLITYVESTEQVVVSAGGRWMKMLLEPLGPSNGDS